jgi:hypothetical protein
MANLMRRFAVWIPVSALCVPYILMAWYPDTFTVCLRYVLSYHLEIAIPLFMHGYGLWLAYKHRRIRFGSVALATFCCISIVAAIVLLSVYTQRMFWAVVVIPTVYIVTTDVLIRQASRHSRRVSIGST